MQAKPSSVPPRRQRRTGERLPGGMTMRPPRPHRKPKPAKRTEQKATTTPEQNPAEERAARAAAVGATVEELDDLRDWVLRELEADFEPISPDAANHAMLMMFQWVAAALGLRPCDVEACTNLRRQHQRKLRPDTAGEGEMHVTEHTVVRWSNGMRLNAQRMRAEAYRRFLGLLLSSGFWVA